MRNFILGALTCLICLSVGTALGRWDIGGSGADILEQFWDGGGKASGDVDLDDNKLYLDETNDVDTYIEQNTTSDTARIAVGGAYIDITESTADDVDFNTFAFKESSYTIATTATVTANAFTWDVANGNVQRVDLEDCTGGGNCTATINNERTGGAYYFIITQGASTETVAWSGGTFKWADGTAPTTTQTDNAIDVVCGHVLL
jgi:hypothetical protein